MKKSTHPLIATMKRPLILLIAMMCVLHTKAQYECISSNVCNYICFGGFEEAVYDGNWDLLNNGGPNMATNDTIWRYFTLDTTQWNTFDLYKRTATGGTTFFGDTSSNPTPVGANFCFFNTAQVPPPPGGQKNFVALANFYDLTQSYNNRECFVFELHSPILPGETYELNFLSRKTIPKCLGYLVMVYGGNQRPCRAPTVTNIDGTVSSCGFKATLLDTMRIDSSQWASYKMTFSPSSVCTHIIVKTKDTLNSDMYAYFDNFSLYKTSFKPLKITANVDTLLICKTQGYIRYVIRSDSSQNDTIPLHLNLPSGVHVAPNSDFDTTGRYRILPNVLHSYDSLVLDLFVTLDTSVIQSARYYNISLEALKKGYCIDENSDYVVRMQRSSIFQMKLNDTLVNPNCHNLGRISVNPSGGTAPYSFMWSDGLTSSSRSDIHGDWIYDLTIVDLNQCSITKRYQLPLVNPTKLDAWISSRLNCVNNTAVMTAKVIDGIPPYTYLWDNGDTTPQRTITSLGATYKVTVTEVSTGCTYVESENTDINSFHRVGDWAGPYPISTLGNWQKKNVRVSGLAYINANLDLNYCDVLLDAGAEIRVNDHIEAPYLMNHLSIQYCNFYTCGGVLAKGLTFESVPPYDTMRIEYNDFRDCHRACYIKEAGGTYHIRNNLFENNLTGFYIRQFTNGLKLSGNRFQGLNNTTQGMMKDYYTGMTSDAMTPLQLQYPAIGTLVYSYRDCHAGIVAENVPNLVIGHASEQPNVFLNMNNGIMLYGGNTTIVNAKMERTYYRPSPFSTGYQPVYGHAVYGLYNSTAHQGRLKFYGYGKNGTEWNTKGYGSSIRSDGMDLEDIDKVKFQGGITYTSHTHVGLVKKLNVTNSKISFISCVDNSVDQMKVYISQNDINASSYSNSIRILKNTLSSVNSSYYINYNTLENIAEYSGGIMIDNVPNPSSNSIVRVSKNYVNMSCKGADVRKFFVGGINYTNCTNILDNENTVIDCPSGNYNNSSPASENNVGIVYNRTTGTFSCNLVNNVYTGVRFFHDCDNSTWTKNKINNHVVGMQIAPNSLLRDQYWCGNSFSGTCTLEALKDPMTLTRFIISNSNPIYSPSPVFPNTFPNVWWSSFTNPKGVETNVCDPVTFSPTGGSGFPIGKLGDFIRKNSEGMFNPIGKYNVVLDAIPLTTVDTAVLTNNMVFGSFETELLWQYRQELYNKLKPFENEYRDTSIFRDYLTDIEDGSINEFKEINVMDRETYESQQATIAQIEKLQFAIDSSWERMRVIDSAIAVTKDSVTRASWLASRQALRQYILSRDTWMRYYITGVHTEYTYQGQNLENRNDTISTEGVSDSLQRVFNAVYYQTYGRLNPVLDSSQFATYYSLAAHCPFENGDVVYRSRGVVKTYIDTMRYDDSVICAPVGYTVKSTKPSKANPKHLEELTYTIFPNPAKDYLNFVFNQIPSTKLDIIISDMTGRVVYIETKKEFSSNSFVVDTKLWSTGVYIAKLYSGNKLISTSDIQIIK